MTPAPAEPAAVRTHRRRPPPGPTGGRLANLRERFSDFPGFLSRLNREYGDVVSYQLPGKDFCVVFDADLIREMLVEKRRFFLKSSLYDVSDRFITKPAVFISEGDDHRRRRKLVERVFGQEHLEAYAEIMVENARALQERWSTGEALDAAREMHRVARTIAFGTFFGRDRQDAQGIGATAVRAFKRDLAIGFLPLSGLLRSLPLPGNIRAARTCRALDEIVFEAIRRARDPHYDGSDLTARMVRSRDAAGIDSAFSDEEVRNEIYVLLLANFDPMASALTWSIDYITRNPTVRERLEQEADEVLGDRPITVADYARLPYARGVFLEAGRLTPPNYYFDREAEEDCSLGGYEIRKGTIMQPCFRVCHRQARHWSQPDEFRPERWLTDQPPSTCPQHAFLMFSHGPRACLGREFATMEGTYILASIAQGFRLEAVADRPPKVDGTLLYMVKGGLPIIATARRSSRTGSTRVPRSSASQ
ncbi:cytochrome P450 [Candidatus Palauibacter sp.]|uniref:cytochrome P450 n=1 Tax=Candidatus Palauibacter sp. TaxID=3101350 RepID=UPI003B525373